eukprot:1191253-Prorocentrum_minimum.AAC.1
MRAPLDFKRDARLRGLRFHKPRLIGRRPPLALRPLLGPPPRRLLLGRHRRRRPRRLLIDCLPHSTALRVRRPPRGAHRRPCCDPSEPLGLDTDIFALPFRDWCPLR